MDEKQSRLLLERIAEAEQRRDSEFGELWQDCARRYCSQPEHQREGSNIFVPYTFMQTEVIKARLEESLFAQRPYLSALPRESNDTELARQVQLLLDWQLNERIDLPRVISEELAASLIIYGTAIAFTGWQESRRRVKRALTEGRVLTGPEGEPLLDEAGREIVTPCREVYEEWELVADDPLVVCIPLADFYVDPAALTIADARFCGHREYLTRAALEELAEGGKYSIDWEHLQRAEREDKADGSGEAGDSFDPADPGALFLLHHYWEDGRHLVFLERSQCICEEANPFWHGEKPYDKCCYAQVPGQFYGLGVPQLLAGLQDELNTARNQRIDYNTLALRRMWKLRKGCGLTSHDLIWRQNGVLQVENMDDVQEINLQPLPADAFSNEAAIKQDMQDVTGCYDILLGVSYVNETATTTMTRDNNASLRFKTVVRAIIKDLLLPIARKCVALDRQFLDSERTVRLTGEVPELFSISPAELQGDYDIVYCGAAIDSLANRELTKERVLQAYSLALADPAYQRDDVARLRLFRKALEALEISDADRLLPQIALTGGVAADGAARGGGAAAPMSRGELDLLPLVGNGLSLS